jgi:putative transposase
MNRVLRYRLYPTSKQIDALGEMLQEHCTLYNAALQERRDAWKIAKVSIKYSSQSAQLSEIRRDVPDQGRWSFSSQQQTLRRLDKAFTAFFGRIKSGDTPGYPRFKAVRRFDTVTFIDGDGARWQGERLRLQGVGHVKVKLHRPVQGTVKQVSVTGEGRHWYANVICVDVGRDVRPATGAVIGLDRGVKHLLADSNGGFASNPRHVRKAADRLKSAQQSLARRKRKSQRRKKAVTRVAAQHRKVRDTRRDYLHKLSRRIVDVNDVIVLEDLKITNMTRRPKLLPDDAPNGGAAKAGLNKSILDAGWGVLQDMITYKAESAGVEVVLVNPRNTSRTCHLCRHCAAGNRNKEKFVCLKCGHTAHADTNAAQNILGLGLSLQAHAA